MRHNRLGLWIALIGLILSLPWHRRLCAQVEPRFELKISDPLAPKGAQVHCAMKVRGTASIPGGNYLWVLVHRIDFEDVWWPQGEGKIDQKTLEWSVPVTFGGPQDIGHDFVIAVVTVNASEHAKLRDYRMKAMKTEKWLPIEMPPTTTAPQFRTVKKVSHSGCQ